MHKCPDCQADCNCGAPNDPKECMHVCVATDEYDYDSDDIFDLFDEDEEDW